MESNPERHDLFPTQDAYVFSLDVGGGLLRRSGVGWNLRRRWQTDEDGAPDRRDPYEVFPLRGQSVVYDHDAIWGHVLSLRGRAEFKSYGDSAVTSGDMLIRTRDGALIETSYYGVQRLEELGQRKLLTTTDPDPQINVKLAYWLEFDTPSAKYKWLAQTPFVGFGRAQITRVPDVAYDQPGAWGDRDFPPFEFPIEMDVYAVT